VVVAQQSKGLFGNKAVAVATVVGVPIAIASLAVAIQQAYFKPGGQPAPFTTTAGPSRPTATPSDTKTPTPDDPSDGSSPTRDPAPAENPGLRWSGTVRLASGGLDIDSRPAEKRDDGSDIRKDNFTEIAPGPGAHLTAWVEPGTPGYKQCRAHVERNSAVPLFDLPQNSWFCVLTNEGRIAAVRYLGIGDGGFFGFQMTIWER
jgi:hypothetical protein